MRRNLLILFALAACTVGAYAQTGQRNMLSSSNETMDVTRLTVAPPDGVAAPVSHTPFEKKKIKSAAASETYEYYCSAWSFHKNYSFYYEGGEVRNYTVEITYEGTTATIKRLFNLVDGYPTAQNEEYDITGVWDEAAGTITIPTPTDFENATRVGYIQNFYIGCLFAGEVSETGTLVPEDELVFYVSDDKAHITTEQNFAVANFMESSASQMGFYTTYKDMVLDLPGDTPALHTFQSVLQFGDGVFPELTETKEVILTNSANVAADYAITCDGEGFSADPIAGTIPAQGCDTLIVSFSPLATGEYEGIITVENESEPLLIQMTGASVPAPDYSAIIKEGDMKILTCMDYPFAVVDTLPVAPAAISTNIGPGVVSTSWLQAAFTVPEGKLGTFSWKGMSNSSDWYYFYGNVYVDEELLASYTSVNMDISNGIDFGPGEHTVRFEYVRNGYGSSWADNSRTYMYVYDLAFTTTDLQENAAVIDSETLDFGNFIYEGESLMSTANITLTNKGAQPLRVTGVVNDGAFTVEKPEQSAETMKTLTIPVTFQADAVGEYEGSIQLATTAGNFTVDCGALVREMPDFSQIVKKGDFTFTTDGQHPFLVENGRAYNSTAKEPDYVYTTAKFRASFTVPEGYRGTISWKGRVSCSPDEYGGWKDNGNIMFQKPMSGYSGTFIGEEDCSAENFYPDTEDILVVTSGEHYIEFSYNQCGDTVYVGEDRMEIWDLELDIYESQPYDAEIDITEIDFGSIYEGKTASGEVNIKNIGTNNLSVTDVLSDGPFLAEMPEMNGVVHGRTMTVPIIFKPTEAGIYEGTVVIKTQAGDFEVKCKGEAITTDDILVLEDFEDDAANWRIYDADGDGRTWDLAWNLFGGQPEGHTHGGSECIASVSIYQGAELEPDNYTFRTSPVTIPEEGATITWWVGSENEELVGDHYSLLLSESVEDLEAMDNVFSETLDKVEWQHRTYHLYGEQWAGKEIYVGFRHHDCIGRDIVKIDDLIIYKGIKDSVAENMTDGKQVVAQEYYSVSGMKLEAPVKGLNIMRTVYDDGTAKTVKLFVE